MADARVSFTPGTGHSFSPVYQALGLGWGEDRHTSLLSPPQTHLAKSTHHTCLCGEQNPAQLLASTCLEQLIFLEHNQGSQEPQPCSQRLSWSLSIPLMTVLLNEHHREPHLPSTEFSAPARCGCVYPAGFRTGKTRHRATEQSCPRPQAGNGEVS